MEISVDVPDEYVLDQSPAEIGRRLKLYAALLMFQSGEISAGGATHLAGVDRFTFAAECARRGIALVNHSASDLHDEVESLRPLS
jgi:predicted HTH domain antitoxin